MDDIDGRTLRFHGMARVGVFLTALQITLVIPLRADLPWVSCLQNYSSLNFTPCLSLTFDPLPSLLLSSKRTCCICNK